MPLRGQAEERSSRTGIPMPPILRAGVGKDRKGFEFSKKRGLESVACDVPDASVASAKRMTMRGGEASVHPGQSDESKTSNSDRSATSGTDAIDEGLYSRQLYVLGHEAMRRMQRCSILLVGLGGLGVEIAKNLALAGVKSLTLHDPRPVELADLSSQFYCTEADIGKNRANVSRDRLADLNQYVKIDVLEGQVGPAEIANFSLVICTDAVFGECVLVNDACRDHGIAFIMAQTRGVYGNIFVDFGPEFVVTDDNGENPAQAMVSHISQDSPGLVTTLDEQRHGFEDGDLVTFTEVQGMVEVNGMAPVPVKVLGPYTFTIGDTSKLSAYTSGGYARQVKQPRTVAFKSLRASLLDPEFTTSDFAKIERERQLLVAFQAVDSFCVQLEGTPRPGCAEDADAVVELAHQFNREVVAADGVVINKALVEKVDEGLVRRLARCARGSLAPMAAVIGSIAAQEAMKACTGKFMPVRQWFMFDADEALPPADLPQEEFEPEGSRYDGQIAV
eukprot:CAMPEP_0172160716 /NCGR_PEP_ID=MMETSP1050-20130122/5715_1 /TAXON_ID=233186 /ORGANISM="Cryptomonas curvata, Strain CCAP979/52" /LENGTH=504 /DNA_ID=CAMNT_0012830515 /DNA_START=177 /DNA_END=1687 /DNA_ORIENTATION=-